MSSLHFLALSWIIAAKGAPFVGWAMIGCDSPLAQQAFAPEAAAFDVHGECIDGDLPVTYRLPAVPAASAPVDQISLDPMPLFLPPLPAAQSDTPYTAAGSPPDDGAALPAEIEQAAPSIPGPQFIVGDVAAIASAPPQAAPPAPPTTELAAQLVPAVQRGFVLAQRGALFAARTEFVQVLRRVAQAKDMAANSDEHSQALAAGLRALDEADDFVPEGVQLEAELDVAATASSHRTPALDDSSEERLPHEAVARYHDYARAELAKAVAGEQAGSMALYGLGRIDAQLAQRKDDDVRFVRDAMTMYAAALEACPNNHLAANELGVLECRTGRPGAAARLFERTIDFAPTATAYHNLAVAQHKLGLHGHAQANEQESERLAAMERAVGGLSRRAGVQWVSPDELARVAQPSGLTPPPTQAATAQPAAKSPWQRALELTRGLPRPRSASASSAPPDSTPATQIARPPSQHYWR